MLITIDTAQPITDQDRQIIQAILDDTWPPSVTPAPKAEEPKAPAKPRRKAAPKKVASPESAPSAASPEEAENKDDGPTLDDAVKAVRDKVSAGKKEEVKAALAEVGVRRASEMETPEQIAEFLKVLNG